MEKKTEKTTRIEEVEYTPFSLLIEEENDVMSVKIVSGKYLCSKKVFKSVEDALDYIMARPWELIMSMFIILKKEMKDE